MALECDKTLPVLKSRFLCPQKNNVNVNHESDDSDESDNEQSAPLFVIDKTPGRSETRDDKFLKSKANEVKLDSSLKTPIDTSGYFKSTSGLEAFRALDKMEIEDINEDLRAKMAIGPGFEKANYYRESKRERKKRKKMEREKTKGEGWFNLPATEITEEKKRDLMLLQMRNVWNPKRFYKKNESKELPKYFQVATVVDSPSDFYTDRVPKKNRKNTIVDELLADDEFRKWNKKKYVEALKNNPYYLRIARRKKKKTELLKAMKKDEKTNKSAKKHAKRLKKQK